MKNEGMKELLAITIYKNAYSALSYFTYKR